MQFMEYFLILHKYQIPVYQVSRVPRINMITDPERLAKRRLLYYNVLQEAPMRKVMSVSIEEELLARLEKTAARNNARRSEIVRQALSRYLYTEEMDRLRESLRPHAEAAGYFSDEDVYRDVT